MAVNKLLIGIGLVGSAFIVATIVLGVLFGNADQDLQICIAERAALEAQCIDTGVSSTTESSPTPAPVESTTVGTGTEPPPLPVNYRLPDYVTPILYTLDLNPNLETQLFSGENEITLRITQATNEIILHSNGLTIDSAEFFNGQTAIGSNFVLAPIQEFLIVTLNQIVQPGENYRLRITFNGDLRNRIVGLYSSAYTNEQGGQTYIATSKFEPTYARQAYPCFDEPAMKAKYAISIVHPTNNNYMALSNMNALSTSIITGTTNSRTYFNESVPMSSYLSCFIVSDFISKDREIQAKGVGDNFDLRVFAQRAQIDKVDFALDVGAKITEYYIDYFQVPYPLPKLDMVAIPDFVSGAMEHWGLVTYRETALLFDPSSSSTANKQRVASVVAHELAHMWFGNLVTMLWWDELWLNEGFASYIEYKGVNAALPEWELLDQFIIDDLHSVMDLDATLASHPIVQTAENPDQITELFDSITYAKGASVIRMLEDFVGPAVFKQGVTNYLNEHAYGNAVTLDLLSQIQPLIPEIDVTFIMSTWTRQMGYPVVNVEVTGTGSYRLRQKHFLSNPENESPNDSEFNYRWYIPITYETDSLAKQQVWFTNTQNEVEITASQIGSHRWIKFNVNQVGYYRVNYPETMWLSFAEHLKTSTRDFSVTDRAHLLNDAFSLAEATLIKYDTALALTDYLSSEDQYVPWSVAASKLGNLRSLLYYTSSYNKFVSFAQSLIKPIYTGISWTVGENYLENHLRTTILSAACSMGLTECMTRVGIEFDNWLANPQVRPYSDLRNLIYYNGMASRGDEAKWDQMWQLYLNEQDAQEKAKLMYGLAGIQVPWLLKRFVDLAANETYVRGQDYFTCIQQIAANRVGESIVWDYVRENWPNLVNRFGLNERYLGRMIPSITGRFSTELKLNEVRSFFAQYPEAGAGEAARQQTIANIQNKIKWLENNEGDIETWLVANVPDQTQR